MFEIATLILLAGNTCDNNRQALKLIVTDTEVGLLEPGVCRAIERLAREKKLFNSHMWSWDYEYSRSDNIAFMRKWYFEIDKLPLLDLDLIKLLPPRPHIDTQNSIINNTLVYLHQLKAVAAPWELDNIQLLIEETQILQTYWVIMYNINHYQQNNNELWCRLSIQDLQNKFDTGDILLIWSVPTFPFWHVPRTN